MVDIPNVKAAEPIPSQVMSEITDLMNNGDLFRYNSEGSAAHRLEIEFSKVMGVRYSLAVSSCSAALFLALKSLNLPRNARVLMPAFTFAAVPSYCDGFLCQESSSIQAWMAQTAEVQGGTLSARAAVLRAGYMRWSAITL